MKKLAGIFFVAFLSFYANAASAQLCNDNSGFLKSFGPIPLGDTVILGPDCQHLQDGGTSGGGAGVPYVFPSSFGAKCDGSTNDGPALQSMLTASAGKTIFIPAGSSCVTLQTLNVPSLTTFTGAGRNDAGIRCAGAAIPCFQITNQSNIDFSNFYCSGTDHVASWASSPVGCFRITQNGSAVQTGQNFRFSGMKLLNFNATFWTSTDTAGTTFPLKNITYDNIVVTTTTNDIPTDPTPTNNNNWLFYHNTAGAGNGRIENIKYSNIDVQGDAFCFGFFHYSNVYKVQIQNSSLRGIGTTVSATHCQGGLAQNAYDVAFYDNAADGNPPSDLLISGNYFQGCYSACIYFAGDGNIGHASLSFNNFNALITGNSFAGQTSNDDLVARAAVAINLATNINIVGNFCTGNYGCIGLNGQNSGTIYVTGNFCYTTASASALHPSYCLLLQPGAGTTTNTQAYIASANDFQNAGGANSRVIRSTSSVGAFFDVVELTDNKIVASDFGIDFNSAYFNKNLKLSGNRLSGVASTSLADAGSISGGGIVITHENIYDQILTNGTGFSCNNCTLYAQGDTFLNRNAGAAYSFSATTAVGTISGLQFHNVAAALQVAPASMGLALPTNSASAQDYVQNLNVGNTVQPIAWINTANGNNWKAVNPIDPTSWTAYVPTVTAATGALTTASATGRYKCLGKLCFIEVDATVTTAGTGAGALRVTLPFTSATANYTGSAYEYTLSAKSGAAIIRFALSTGFMSAIDSTGTTFIANGATVMYGMTYETP